MLCSRLLFLLNLVLLMIFLSGCGQSEDQREFEREARSAPQGFTETNERGEIIDGNEDPDDWRVAPFYQGLVNIFPAYPNPVLTNDRLIIEVQITGIDAVTGIQVYAYYGTYVKPLYSETSNLFGLISISLNPLDIAERPEAPQGLYRIIIMDSQNNIISYGDVQVQ